MEWLAAISALLQVGTGIWQGIKGSQAANEERPTYEMPDEVKQLLGIAQQQAYGDMPGYQQAKSNIEQQAATGFSRAENVAQSGSDLLGYVAASGVGQNRAMNELAASNAAYQTQQKERLKDALRIVAGYQDQEFNVNQLQPYQESQDAAAVMREGAIQNIVGGVQGGVSNYMSYDLYSKMLGLDNNASSGLDYSKLLEDMAKISAKKKGSWGGLISDSWNITDSPQSSYQDWLYGNLV